MRSLLLVMLWVLLMTACAEFKPRSLNSVDLATQLETRSLQSDDFNQFVAEISKQQSNNEYTSKVWNLDRLTLAAIYYHPDIRLARAQLANAEAVAITAGQRPNPSFAITPAWISNLAGTPPWIVVSALSIPIETAGKRGYRIDRSDYLIDAARLRITDAIWQVRTRLRLAMLDVCFAQEGLRLLQHQRGFQEAINHHLQQQQRAGEIAYADRLTAEQALQQIQLNVTLAQKKLNEGKAVLAATIGVPLTALTKIELDFTDFKQVPNLQSVDSEQLKTVALHQRPDVLAALADYSAAQSAVQLEIANQYPNLQLNPGYTWNTGENRWLMGVAALQLPIFNQNEGPIAEAEAKRREAAIRVETLQLRIIAELDRAYAGVHELQTRTEAAKQFCHNRQENLRTVESLLTVGEQDAHAVATAKLELAIAERTQLDVLQESQQTIALLESALRYPMTTVLTTQLFSSLASGKIAL